MATTTQTSSRTTLVATSDKLPSPFDSRYEIRHLTEKDIEVAAAIVIHCNVFNSTVWPITYPTGKTKRAYDGLPAADYLVRHQVTSGHSFGVFDTQYKFKTKSGEAAGGEVKWDFSKTDLTAEDLDAQIDSPMISVALSYDGFNHLDLEKLGPLMEVIPLYGDIFHRFDITDPRDPESFKATAPGQILMRNATATRTAAQGLGIMSGMANWLMRYAQSKGYKHINIECFDERVNHVWSNPKTKGITAQETTAFRTEDFMKVDENGKIYKAFGDAKQRVTRVWVTL